MNSATCRSDTGITEKLDNGQ